MTNTPIQSDEELINFVRQKIQEPIEEVRKGAVEWHLECENDIKSSGEIMGDGKEEIRRPEAYMVNVIVSMIKAYSQQIALEARIDELEKLPFNWEACYDNTLRKHYSKVYDDVYNKRLYELRAEQRARIRYE